MFSPKTFPDISVQTAELLQNMWDPIPSLTKSTSQNYIPHACAFLTSKMENTQFLHDRSIVLTNSSSNSPKPQNQIENSNRCLWDRGIKSVQGDFQPQMTLVAMEMQDSLRKKSELQNLCLRGFRALSLLLSLPRCFVGHLSPFQAVTNEHFSKSLDVHKEVWKLEHEVVFLKGLYDGCCDLQTEDPAHRLKMSVAGCRRPG